jgi:uroporphyrinogen-III synthase
MTDNPVILPVILIVRPEPQASRFASELREVIGDAAEVVVRPVMAPRFFGAPIDGNAFSAAIFTSETGVTGAARLWTGAKGLAFAVGDRTAEAASALGWLCESAEGAGPELAALIARSGLAGPMVWPKGKEGGKSFLEAAQGLGIEIVPQVVYQQEPVTSPSGQPVLAPGQRLILPLFSPRTARLARTQVTARGIEAVAISQAAAEAWGAPVARVAERPNGPAMIDAVAAILHQATT